jgi:predicted outer membrane repeat protein
LAVDRVVQADGLGEYETIDDAVGACNDGDRVVLMPGIYTGAGNHDIQVEASVTIEAFSSADDVVIDCGGTATTPQRAFNIVDGWPTFRNLTITGGYHVDGGAIRIETYTPTIEGCRFIGNQAERGGAIFASGADGVVVDQCLFFKNRATDEGAGVYAFGDFPVVVSNSTFCRNGSPNGSGVFISDSATLDLSQSILVLGRGSPAVESYYGGAVTAVQCDIWGNSGGDWTYDLAPLLGVNGNIAVDPLFCDPDADAPNCKVTANSPAKIYTWLAMGSEGYDDAWTVPVYGVSDDGTGMFPTIQAALDTVPVPGEVVLRAGRYAGPGNFALTFRGKDITLRSRDLDAASTVISGSASQDRVIWLHDGETTAATISHLQIEQGNANQADDYTGYGGGILLTGAEATIRGCIIKWNEAEHGANISANNEAYELVIEDCLLGFANGNGADLFFQGRRLDLTGTSFLNWSNRPDDAIRIAEWAGDVLVDDCLFENFTQAVVIEPLILSPNIQFLNTTFNAGQEAIVMTGAQDVSLNECTFSGMQGGRALYADDCALTISNSHFLDNSAPNFAGAAIYLRDSNVLITDTEFVGNETDQNGGALYSRDTELDLTRCVFTNNRCLTTIFDPNGGAVFQSGGSLDILEGRFYDNHGDFGGAVFCENALMTCHYTIFSGNQGAHTSAVSLHHGNPIVELTHNLFAGNIAGPGPALYAGLGDVYITKSTFVANEGVPGTAQVQVFGGANLMFAQNIVANGINTGGIASGVVSGTWDLSCNDIYGNEVGAYLGDVAIWEGINGNIAADPVFCDPVAGDYTLRDDSPCLAANNACGLKIGALGQGCLAGSPVFDDGLPQVLTLGGNTPNPFNPRTEIRFTLPTAARVALDIHDVAGRKIQSLLSGKELDAGSHDVMWNGTDHAGRAVPSGTYLYRVVAGSEVVAGKMVLLR